MFANVAMRCLQQKEEQEDKAEEKLARFQKEAQEDKAEKKLASLPRRPRFHTRETAPQREWVTA